MTNTNTQAKGTSGVAAFLAVLNAGRSVSATPLCPCADSWPACGPDIKSRFYVTPLLCCAEKQLAHARERAAAIPELEATVARLRAGGVTGQGEKELSGADRVGRAQEDQP